MVKGKTLQILNIVAFILVIVVNYVSNTRLINSTTIGEVSNNYQTLFTPVGYTFSIWGLIYLLLLGFVIYQSRSLFSKQAGNHWVFTVGWWFVISCICNLLWILAWVYDYTGLSCVLILLLLFSLIKIIFRTRTALDDEPITTIAFIWWPFSIYSGWVTVASIANISAYLYKIGWDGFGLDSIFWTITMIIAAVIINITITWTRNMREFAVVGAWALVGIGMANKDLNIVITYVSILAAFILLVNSAIHGWKNRSTNPLNKLQEYLNN